LVPLSIVILVNLSNNNKAEFGHLSIIFFSVNAFFYKNRHFFTFLSFPLQPCKYPMAGSRKNKNRKL